MAQGYTYKIYKFNDPASGTVLQGVTCTTTNDPFTKTCVAPVPAALNVSGTTLDMTAIVLGIETPHSTSAVVPAPLQPSAAPANLRFIQEVAAFFMKPFRVLGSLKN